MLDNYYKMVLTVVAAALFGHQKDIESGFDDALADELIAQGVLPIALSGAGSVGAEEFRKKWSKRSNEIVAANLMISYEHTQLHELMTENRIPYVILQGAASASYYPTPILRTMGDVDFLVKERDVARAGALLAA